MSHRTARVIDIVLAAWLVLWCIVGLTVGRAVNGLGRVSDGVIGAGEGIADVGDGFQDLSDVPVIGGGIGAVADRINGLGQATIERGESSKDTVFGLALIVALVVSLGPTLPPIAVWVVLRGPLARERRSIRSALDAGDAGIQGYLALRAATRTSYPRLRAVTADPWGDLLEGRHAGMASLELRRLGLRRHGESARQD